jgi:Lrp/AsnC family leucine-responsive transcriptional regulator
MGLILDKKDKKLLYELDLNSRRTLKELAKAVGLSKNSISYRIENLKQRGVIKQFHTILDVGKLGFTSYRLYLSLENVTKQKETEILQFLCDQSIVTWAVSVDGEYDIALLLLVNKSKDLTNFWNELLRKYLNHINKRNLSVMSASHYFSRAYFLDLPKNSYELNFISEPTNEILVDSTDRDILKYLAPNSDISILNLSEKTGLNTKTVISRIKKMKDLGVILGYKAVLDLEKLGFQYYKIHCKLHAIDSDTLQKIYSYIFNHPNIVYRNEIIGGEDLDFEVQVKNVTALRNLLEEMKEKFGNYISSYSYLHYYKEHKFVLMPI